MPIRLVALDLDGTLLTPQHTIAPATKQAIAAARAKGLRFAIVTGRMFCSARPYAEELELEGMPVIGYNGALAAEYPSGRFLVHEPLPLETSLRLAEYCEERGLHLQAYVDDRLYVAEHNASTRVYEEISGVRPEAVGNLRAWLKAPPTKLLIHHDPAGVPGIMADMRERFGHEANIFPSMSFFIEMTRPGVDKGHALAALAGQLGLAAEEVAAFGDGFNDESMLRWAGTGVAMAQAPEQVKAVAQLVTSAEVGDGVAEGLRLLGLA